MWEEVDGCLFDAGFCPTAIAAASCCSFGDAAWRLTPSGCTRRRTDWPRSGRTLLSYSSRSSIVAKVTCTKMSFGQMV